MIIDALQFIDTTTPGEARRGSSELTIAPLVVDLEPFIARSEVILSASLLPADLDYRVVAVDLRVDFQDGADRLFAGRISRPYDRDRVVAEGNQ